MQKSSSMAANINMDDLANIEVAKFRYMNAYRNQFVGRREDYRTLSELTEVKLRDVRILAPNFYRTKLHTLVNQAATRLLFSQNNVNATHRIFLMILDGLITSQPTGDVDFETEKKHIDALDKLHKQQKELRAEEQRLAAAENDYDDLENDTEGYYVQHEITQRKLLKVSKAIARLTNLRAEEMPFTLETAPGQGIDILKTSKCDIFDKIEQGIKNILSSRTKGRTRMELPDRGLIKDLLNEVLGHRVNSDDAKIILEEVYGALRNYFRDLDEKRTEEQHHYYINSDYLLPREGEILTDPDNISSEVLYKLNKSKIVGEEKMNKVLSSFASKNKAILENGGPNKIPGSDVGPIYLNGLDEPDDGDDCDIDDEEEEDEESEDDEDDSDIEILDIGYTNEEMHSLVRVKEEPPENSPLVQQTQQNDNRPTDNHEEQTFDQVMIDPFAELETMLRNQEALTYNIDSLDPNNPNIDQNAENDAEMDEEEEEEDDDGDNNDDDECQVIQCLDREDKIQTVDLLDDEGPPVAASDNGYF